jgi:hypothetical protein
MKMLVDYLDRAMQFEHMAAVEVNPDLKATFLKQAADYRSLAAKRAAQLRMYDATSPLPK